MSPFAQMISPDAAVLGGPLLRRHFRLDTGHGGIVSARLRVTALGVIEATVNGHPASDALLTPGWTSYEWRLRVASFDVAPLITTDSVIGLRLGNGWYHGRLGWTGARHLYGDSLGALAELTISFEDGHVQQVITDDQWRCAAGATTDDDLYDGQRIDARRRASIDGWDTVDFDDTTWAPVTVLPFDPAVLVEYVGPDVVRQQEVLPTNVWRSPTGRTLVDFGQNLVGWVRVRVHGSAGEEVVLRHAEVLEDDELGTRPLRSALATDRFVLSGDADEFEPTFTFHGFRYVEVTGWPGEIEPGDLTAIVIGSDLTPTGRFSCSDPLLEQFHRNVVWGMRGNFVDVPTDCPQRDERLGWTGDIAAFAPTAAFLFDISGFMRDWLRDVDAEQRDKDGLVPFVVPDVLKYLPHPADLGEPESTAVWSDAAVWVPWALWNAYGDRAALEEQFGAMTAHVRRVRSLLSPNGLWDSGFQFGDWLDPDAPPEEPIRAKADMGVVATACAYRSASIAAAAAAALDRDEERAEFASLASDLRRAYNQAYVDSGRVRSDCATVYALSIVFDLLDEPDRELAGERLAELVEQNGYRISTGFAGTPFITDALTDTGHLDAAYRLLTERSNPSWLYPVTMGATTVWERWDSMLPDGTINPGEMTSFNHYALGAVADWMHRTIGGIAPLEPGYRSFLVHPRPGGGITSAEISLRTPQGTAAVAWRLIGDELVLDVEVPDGATAVVRREGLADQTVGGGSHRYRSAAGVLSAR